MPYMKNRFAEEKHVPAPVGDNVTVRGAVVSLKERFTQYGATWKMTVKVQTPDGSWLVWGTVPRALANSHVGDTVEFTAKLEAARDAAPNTHFVFAKRPRNAKLVARSQGTDAAPVAAPAPELPKRPSLVELAAQLEAPRAA